MHRRTAFIQKLLSFASALAVLLLLSAFALKAPSQTSPGASRSRQSDPPLAQGRQFFERRCAACHGLDGHGGERAPDIATRPAVQQRSDAELTRIIRDGVPQAGMPAFSTLDDSTMKSLVGYIRVLQGKGDVAKLPGDPRNGETIFFAKGKCSECHLISGKGGFIASDLSTFAQGRSVAEIREAIVTPDAGSRQNSAVVVTTHDGQKLTGVVRNEDNFSVQLQTLDGAFHLLLKTDLEGISQPASLMPVDYGSTLTPQELNDLIAYLMTAAKVSQAPAQQKKFREDEENE